MLIDYEDNDGFFEQIFAPLGVLPYSNDGEAAFKIEGSLPSLDTQRTGTTGLMKAHLKTDDPDGNGEFSYRWQVSQNQNEWTEVGQSSTYEMATGLLEDSQLRLIVNYVDQQGFPAEVEAYWPIARAMIQGKVAELKEVSALTELSEEINIQSDNCTINGGQKIKTASN